PLRVEEARRVADEQEAVAVKLRDRVEAARGNRLRAVANHLPAFEQLSDERMLFEPLELGVRIKKRVLIIQAGDVTEIDDAILHPVNPAAAVCVRVRRIAERVRDAPRRIPVVGQLPKLLDADAV